MRIALDANTPGVRESKNWLILKEMLNGGISLDNLRGALVEGNTSFTPNASKTFPHNQVKTPAGAIVIMGNVYVNSVDDKVIDIRSAVSNSSFKVFIIMGN